MRQIAGLPVYGGSEQVKAVTNIVKDEDELVVGDNLKVRYFRLCSCIRLAVDLSSFIDASRPRVILEIRYAIMLPIPPTLRRLYLRGMLFDVSRICGHRPPPIGHRDTLFTAGCGRFFEGTPEAMQRALSYLGRLPDSTVVYSGHEYTRGNLEFAQSVV